jgi:hypothetical protein
MVIVWTMDDKLLFYYTDENNNKNIKTVRKILENKLF